MGEAVVAIAGLSADQRTDVDFLEREFIPALELNDESLREQPSELSASFGKGLHIWQYPSQLAPYLAWLSRNARPAFRPSWKSAAAGAACSSWLRSG
ncbi:hypothetical protein [Bradyrhizobium uaiense]|uniref:hypothetical protein n=1 Tax=Bradyrhizobium uaiense TaxID=2594946 RepID=UPI0013D78B0E|nr:hypothetical protein [Bradyrhizobium uaiense]